MAPRSPVRSSGPSTQDQDLHQEYPLGEATTDPAGHYRIGYTAAQFHRPGQKAANLLVRAYIPGVATPLESDVRPNAGIDETIDLTVGAAFVVKGVVRLADGGPIAGAVVKAFDKDLRREQPLGDTPTDVTGAYLIRYTADQFRRAEKKTADLILRAYDSHSNLLAESSLLFNAATDETIDLSVGGVYRGPSEYTRLLDEITPLLEGLSPADLEENDEHHDISFLTGETGEDAQRITFLVLAHRLMNKTSLAADIFYGLFREGLPTDLPTLLAQSPDLQRQGAGPGHRREHHSQAFRRGDRPGP